jgi:hypothetical protein
VAEDEPDEVPVDLARVLLWLGGTAARARHFDFSTRSNTCRFTCDRRNRRRDHGRCGFGACDCGDDYGGDGGNGRTSTDVRRADDPDDRRDDRDRGDHDDCDRGDRHVRDRGDRDDHNGDRKLNLYSRGAAVSSKKNLRTRAWPEEQIPSCSRVMIYGCLELLDSARGFGSTVA